MKNSLIYAIIICVCITISQTYAHQSHFDVMTDCAYPVSSHEEVRHDIAQGLYFLQQASMHHSSQEFTQALQALEHAHSGIIYTDDSCQDNQDTLVNLLNQINVLINSLHEQETRLQLSDVYDRLQDRLQ
ncbi:hypothetical protein [Candidatus Chromulinivorax destructor]|uniref:Uncharacterized protein n=1 Tax=Candidatus Chromulinivorax destructor TaxID=2066483 RepID=A0A345ZCT1_9BACT|nr:hypothetical protein [Candidatus Chromulinivorax destructor]AXK61098.1 hypothetical protein C0J27_05195 [Candidatus Chromulinivorax destructor]